MKYRTKIQRFLIFGVMVLSILLSRFLFPQWRQEPADEFLDATGIILVLFGFLFRISARGYKAEKSCNGECLIKNGPYRLIRNPMYLGTLLIGTGVILVLFKWWAFLLFSSVFLLIYIPQIKREEKELSKKFRDEYMEYCRKTPGYFPDLSALFELDPREYLFLKWRWVNKEILAFIVTICWIIAIETREDIKLFGHPEFIKEPLELFLIITTFIIILFYKNGKKLQ